MSATTLLEAAAADGVELSLSPAGTLKASGERAAVGRWLDRIRAHKPAITAALLRATPTADAPDPDPARAARFRRALALLAETPHRQVALVTDLDAEPGFVLVTLAFQGRGLIELAIPEARYDGADLLRRFLAHYGDGPPGPGGAEQGCADEWKECPP